MSDTQRNRCSTTALVHPLKRYPIVGDGDVPGYVNVSRLEFNRFERQALTGLRSDPVGQVSVFVDRRGSKHRPTYEILVE